MRWHELIDRRRWAVVRRRVLERDGHRCKACGRAGRLEVDHIVPLAGGGKPYDMRNLQALCRGCHIAKTKRENQETAAADYPQQAAWRELVESML